MSVYELTINLAPHFGVIILTICIALCMLATRKPNQ